MGGKSKAPATPDYAGLALQSSNLSKYNEQGPEGNVSWSLRPGADPKNPQAGDYVRTTTQAPQEAALSSLNNQNQLAAGQAAAGQLSQLNSQGTQTLNPINTATGVQQPGAGYTSQLDPNNFDRQKLQDSIYNRSTQYYDQNFGDQEDSLRSRLINQGLTEGSEAYDREMRNFGQQRQSAYADATDRAIMGADEAARAQQGLDQQYDLSRFQLDQGQQGLAQQWLNSLRSGDQQDATLNLQQQQLAQTSQNDTVNRLAQILAMSRGEVPTSANSSTQMPDLASAAQQNYQTQLANVNARNAQSANTIGTLGSLGAAAASFFL